MPWDTNVKNVWPPVATGQRFARPIGIDTYIQNLQAELGKGTDFQGAISYAYGIIASDIADLNTTNPQLLPRTRYVVVLLTDGTPYPRCSANDNLSQYADPARTRSSSGRTRCPDYCNLTDAQGTDAINGFIPGTDRNQNYQIFSYVDQLMQLKPAYNVGDIRHAHRAALQRRGRGHLQFARPALPGHLRRLPQHRAGGLPARRAAGGDLARCSRWPCAATACSRSSATQDIQNLGLGALDYTSLASKNVLKTLMVRSLRSVPDGNGRAVDSDGDGLKDDDDQPSSTAPTSSSPTPTATASTTLRGHPLRPRLRRRHDKDIRGCDPASPLTRNCVVPRHRRRRAEPVRRDLPQDPRRPGGLGRRRHP